MAINKAEMYTGHAEGGLQGHSMGYLYPWTVVVYGLNPPVYRAENLKTGVKGWPCRTYDQAFKAATIGHKANL